MVLFKLIGFLKVNSENAILKLKKFSQKKFLYGKFKIIAKYDGKILGKN